MEPNQELYELHSSTSSDDRSSVNTVIHVDSLQTADESEAEASYRESEDQDGSCSWEMQREMGDASDSHSPSDSGGGDVYGARREGGGGTSSSDDDSLNLSLRIEEQDVMRADSDSTTSSETEEGTQM